MKVRTKLLIDIETEYDDNESSNETVRYCVEQDLEDNGYEVHRIEIIDKKDDNNITC